MAAGPQPAAAVWGWVVMPPPPPPGQAPGLPWVTPLPLAGQW